MRYRQYLNIACWIIVPTVLVLAIFFPVAKASLTVLLPAGILLWRFSDDRGVRLD